MVQSKISELDSLIAAYKLEFEKAYTVFIPNTGFANYIFEEDNAIYIQEVFVNRNMRGVKFAAKLTDMCIEDANNRLENLGSKDEIKKLYTTVNIDGPESDSTLKAVTAYNFKVFKLKDDLIYFYKEIK